MNCLRCGRETTGSQVFCNSCRQNMDAYPVRQGTAIHLPQKTVFAPAKKKKKRPITPEEHIAVLRKSLRQTRILLILITLALCFAVGMLVYESNQLTGPDIGRNYAVDTTMDTGN